MKTFCRALSLNFLHFRSRWNLREIYGESQRKIISMKCRLLKFLITDCRVLLSRHLTTKDKMLKLETSCLGQQAGSVLHYTGQGGSSKDIQGVLCEHNNTEQWVSSAMRLLWRWARVKTCWEKTVISCEVNTSDVSLYSDGKRINWPTDY